MLAKPEEILNALNIKRTDYCGYWRRFGIPHRKISERVGATGTIYAADIQQEMLDCINKDWPKKG